MRDALNRALAPKKAADANTPAPVKAVEPADAVTPAKHWWARDDATPALAAAIKATVRRAPRHVVAIPGRAIYEK